MFTRIPLKIRPFFFLLSLLLTVALLTNQVLAHAGGKLQVIGQPAGPFLITVWTYPPDAHTNTPLHVTAGVADAATDEIILDAQIMVQVTPLDTTGSPLSGEATIAQSVSQLLYETAGFPLTENGRYRIDVQVTDEQGSGEVSFELEVTPPFNTTWLIYGLVGIAGIAILFIFRFWQKRQTAPTTQPPARPKRRPTTDQP